MTNGELQQLSAGALVMWTDGHRAGDIDLVLRVERFEHISNDSLTTVSLWSTRMARQYITRLWSDELGTPMRKSLAIL